LIDFISDENNEEITVRLSGSDRRDIISMLGYIMRNHVLPKHFIKYYMNIFLKTYGYPFCKWSENLEMKCFIINKEDIRFVLKQKEQQIVIPFKGKCSTKSCNEGYDWSDDEEVFSYIESDERFQEPVISFPRVIGEER
jgi:hypothetical protein